MVIFKTFHDTTFHNIHVLDSSDLLVFYVIMISLCLGDKKTDYNQTAHPEKYETSSDSDLETKTEEKTKTKTVFCSSFIYLL